MQKNIMEEQRKTDFNFEEAKLNTIMEIASEIEKISRPVGK